MSPPFAVFVYLNDGQLTEIVTVDPDSILIAGASAPPPPPPPESPSGSVVNNATHPQGGVLVVETYELFVDSVNAGNAAAAWPALGPAITTGNTASAWASGQQTSELFDYTVDSIVDVSTDELVAEVTFRSEQDAAFGFNNQTCTEWDITHQLVRNSDSSGPTWQINNSSQNPGSPTDCSPTPAQQTTTCTASELPPAGGVQVVNIPTDDPDEGLNFRQLPDRTSTLLATFDNDTSFAATGACEKDAAGSVWWQVSGQGITGWGNSTYLAGV